MLNSLALTLPEIILSVGSLVLLMVAAYAGDRSSRIVTWLAVLTFMLASLLVDIAYAYLDPRIKYGRRR